MSKKIGCPPGSKLVEEKRNGEVVSRYCVEPNIIAVYIRGGLCVDVVNLPHGYKYEVRDWDDQEEPPEDRNNWPGRGIEDTVYDWYGPVSSTKK